MRIRNIGNSLAEVGTNGCREQHKQSVSEMDVAHLGYAMRSSFAEGASGYCREFIGEVAKEMHNLLILMHNLLAYIASMK